MALKMSRILSRSTITTLSIPTRVSSSFRHHRHRSNKSHQLIQIDLDSSSDEVITVGIKKLEDAIHGMIVRRAAPDWLPFLPGYSYWVPPRRIPSSQAMLDVLGKFSYINNNNNNNINNNINNDSVLSDDENMACASTKGWPSSSFFTKGNLTHPVPVVEMEMEMEMKFQDNDTSNSEDEEG